MLGVLNFPKSANEPRKHTCKFCSKAFKRAEHCIRHERIHTFERPYRCRYCSRSYSRSDLVLRHQRTLHPDKYENIPELPQPLPLPQPQPQPLVSPTIIPPHEPYREVVVTTGNGSQRAPSVGTNPPENAPASSTTDQLQDVRNSGVLGEPAVTADDCHPQDIPNHNHQDGDASELFLEGGVDLLDPFQTFDFMNPFMDSSYDSPGLRTSATFPHGDSSSSRFPDTPEATYPATSQQESTRHPDGDKVRPADGAWDETRSPQSTVETQQNGTDGSLSLPKISRSPPAQHTALVFSEENRQRMLADLTSRLPGAALDPDRIASAAALEKHLNSFMDSFNMHLPIFHIPTFDLAQSPSPLVLAMCAIGALLLLDRPNASNLYSLSRQALMCKHQRAELESPVVFWDWSRPSEEEASHSWSTLWLTQTHLLLTYFGAFCGHPEVVVRTMEEIGYLSCAYRLRQGELSPSSSTPRPTTWDSWAERECTKRLLCGIFIVSSLLTITYGLSPGFSVLQHGDLEMPGEQSLWDAETEKEWLERKSRVEQNDTSVITLRLAVNWALNGQSPDALERSRSSKWSPFMATVTMHGVNTLVYHVTDFTHSLDVSGNAHRLHAMQKAQLMAQLEEALGRCYDMIVSARNGSRLVSGDAESPLLFNSLALLRVCYIRAFTDINGMDRNILLRRTRDEMLKAIWHYATKPALRSALLTRVVARALEAFEVPIQAGALLLQKTAALTWSIEHALAGWDVGLFVTKWLFDLEILLGRKEIIDDIELEILHRVSELLPAASVKLTPGRHCLAAELARLWAGFYDDTWVWGVTPRIGWVLRQLGEAFEKQHSKYWT